MNKAFTEFKPTHLGTNENKFKAMVVARFGQVVYYIHTMNSGNLGQSSRHIDDFNKLYKEIPDYPTFKATHKYVESPMDVEIMVLNTFDVEGFDFVTYAIRCKGQRDVIMSSDIHTMAKDKLRKLYDPINKDEGREYRGLSQLCDIVSPPLDKHILSHHL